MKFFPLLFGIFLSCISSAQTPEFDQLVTHPPVPVKLSFAGERVPLEDNDIRERLEDELVSNVYFHSRTIKILKEVGRYRKEVEAILDKEGVPRDFFYLAVAESGLDNFATSPSGAKGMWQIMEATAKSHGLEINVYVDQRRDTYLSTMAACKHLRELKERLGNWTNAAAAYNRGESGLKNAMEGQKNSSFYHLYLNQETYRYIFRILAYKLIIENPTAYGFKLGPEHIYQPIKYKELLIDSTIADLAVFAQEHKTTYKMLKKLNPWLDHNARYALHVSQGKKYKIRIPI